MSSQLLSSPPPIPHPPSLPQAPKPASYLPSPPISHPPSLHLSRRHLAVAVAAVSAAAPFPSLADCSPSDNKTAFLDVSIAGEPAGRITIGLFSDAAPLGAARFAALVTGAAGVSYRRKEFTKVTPAYIQHAGVRSYGADAELARRTGGDLAADRLAAERTEAAERCPTAARVVTGSVGILVRDPSRPSPRVKLVARDGRLQVDEEEVGAEPNGTEFVIAVRDSPELNEAALVVGRVVEGMDVVERIAKVKTVQDNNSSPYFRVAKLIGDKRAVVAERGFNRPYSKIVITNCGLID